jgi:GNAT superfamily N-acetyltransferase
MLEYQNRLRDHWALNLQFGHQGSNDNIWAIAIQIKNHLLSVTRDELMDLLRLRGIDTRPGFYPSSSLKYNNPFIGKYGYPAAEFLSKDIIVLPCGQDLEKNDIKYICDTLIALLDEFKIGSSNYEFEDLTSSPKAHATLEEFSVGLGGGVETFRYFLSRPYDVVRSHDLSLAMRVNGQLAGYAHVETEKNIPWVGVAVVEKGRGKGWGRILLSELLFRASKTKINELHTRADHGNLSAIRLYCSFGFNPIPELSDERAMHLRLEVNKREL